MLKIWGRPTSSNVMKVVWTCAELGLPFERVDIGGPFGGNREPDYLAKNPNGLVPTLEEPDGFLLWESNAIVRYLAALHDAGGLWPEDARLRADADRWMDWQLTRVGPVYGPIFHGLVRTPPEKRDPASIAAAVAATADLFAVLEERLAGRAYLCGDRLTMADIPYGPILHRWFRLDFDRPPFPALEAWYGRLCGRPAFARQVVDIPIV
ncbi:MAG: glutathione S-transferase family protein [Alphaproteobacteria bacterium]